MFKRYWIFILLVIFAFLQLAQNQLTIWRISNLERRIENLERPMPLQNLLNMKFDAKEVLSDGTYLK